MIEKSKQELASPNKEQLEILNQASSERQIKSLNKIYEYISFLKDLPKTIKLHKEKKYREILEQSENYPEAIRKEIIEIINSNMLGILESKIPETDEEKQTERNNLQTYIDYFSVLKSESRMLNENFFKYISVNYPDLFLINSRKTSLREGTDLRYLRKSIELLVEQEGIENILQNLDQVLLILDPKVTKNNWVILKDVLELRKKVFDFILNRETEEIQKILRKSSPEIVSLFNEKIRDRLIGKSSIELTLLNVKEKIKDSEEVGDTESKIIYEQIEKGLLLLLNHRQNLESLRITEEDKSGLPDKPLNRLIDYIEERVFAINLGKDSRSELSLEIYKYLAGELSQITGRDVTFLELFGYLQFKLQEVMDSTNICHAFGLGPQGLNYYLTDFHSILSFFKDPKFKTVSDFEPGINRGRIMRNMAKDFFGYSFDGSDVDHEPITGYLSHKNEGLENVHLHRNYGWNVFIFDREKIARRLTFLNGDSAAAGPGIIPQSLIFPHISFLIDYIEKIQDIKKINLANLKLDKNFISEENDSNILNVISHLGANAYMEFQAHNELFVYEADIIYLNQRLGQEVKDEILREVEEFNHIYKCKIKIVFKD